MKPGWLVSPVMIAALACSDNQAPVPVPATITITSALDTILAVGKSASLVASPRDAAGMALPNVTLTWSTSNAAAITVSNAGLATAVSSGNATVSAMAAPVTGILRMRAVNADLATVTALSNDAFAGAVFNALSASKRNAVQPHWTKCMSGAASGGVVTIMQCGTGVAAEAASATDPTDRVLLAIFRLYSDEAQRRLGL